MESLTEQLEQFFAHHCARTFVDGGSGEIAAQYAAEGESWWMRARVDEQCGVLSIASHCPVRTPGDRLGEMCEYLQRCHNVVVEGHFGLDFGDGEVTFRTSLVYGAGEVDEELIGQLFESNLAAVERFLPGMMAVAYGDVPPAEAVQLPVWPERLLGQKIDAGLRDLFGEPCAPPEGESRPG